MDIGRGFGRTSVLRFRWVSGRAFFSNRSFPFLFLVIFDVISLNAGVGVYMRLYIKCSGDGERENGKGRDEL